MEKHFIIPSVFEETFVDYYGVADNILDGIKIVDFNGKDYIVGNLALREGLSPHKLVNTSIDEIDYQLMAVTGLMIATMGKYSKFVLTTGLPFSTYLPYKNGAEKFLTDQFDIAFDPRPFGGKRIEKASFQVIHTDVITEIEGAVKTIRSSSHHDSGNFLVASLGFGTFDIALSTPKGLIRRTAHSAKGMSYAVNYVSNALSKDHYLNLLTENQIERAFQRGLIVLDRKKINLQDIRKQALTTYYNEVISPAIKQKINDEDYQNTNKLYLVGGGALYPDLVELFQEEFNTIVDVIVQPDPVLAAAKGYCLNSLARQKTIGSFDDRESTLFVGLDIGNSNTVVYLSFPESEDSIGPAQ